MVNWRQLQICSNLFQTRIVAGSSAKFNAGLVYNCIVAESVQPNSKLFVPEHYNLLTSCIHEVAEEAISRRASEAQSEYFVRRCGVLS